MILKNKFVFITITIAIVMSLFIPFILNNFLINGANFEIDIHEETSYEKMLDEDTVLAIVKEVLIKEKSLSYYEDHFPYQISYIEDAGIWDVVGPMNIFKENGMIAFGGTVFMIIDDCTEEVLYILYSH